MQALSKHSDEFQAALDKHLEDIFCLLWADPASSNPRVPWKMLHKFRAVTMKTMTKENFLISRADRGELSTHKLKKLGRNAEKEAIECYKGEMLLGMLRTMSSHPPSISTLTLMHWLGLIPP
jgi:hypothetical protein